MPSDSSGDVKALAGGPLASVSVPLPDRQLGTIVMLDVTGHASAVQAALRWAADRGKTAGTTFRDLALNGTTIAVWSLPDGASKRRLLGVVVKDDLLLIADPPEALGARAGGAK